MIALAVGKHPRQEHLDAPDNAPKVDVQNPLPLFRRGVDKRAAEPHAGVVAEDMHVAERGLGFLRGALDRICAGDIRFDREDIARYLSQYGLGLAQPIRSNVGDDDPHAGLEKDARHAASDAAGAAGDKCDFALEFFHSVGGGLLHQVHKLYFGPAAGSRAELDASGLEGVGLAVLP